MTHQLLYLRTQALLSTWESLHRRHRKCGRCRKHKRHSARGVAMDMGATIKMTEQLNSFDDFCVLNFTEIQ